MRISKGIALWGICLAGVLTGDGRGMAQVGVNPFADRQIEKRPIAEDPPSNVWMLDFYFKDPRIVNVEVPGRGRRNVYSLYYQVSNNTGEPRLFIPRFVWVCHDETSSHVDQLIPSAQLAIKRREDPANRLDIKNSVTMFAEPVPVSNEFNAEGERISYPKLIHGVATWDDIDPKCDRFSIFVYGLSNGSVMVDGPDDKPILRRKTLQLKFKRLGDEFNPTASEIRYEGHNWIYAPVDVPIVSGASGQ